ncbi:MAG: thiol-disulfide isomerase/thioredoxin [Gammaproteobacteria bacterium]|jgi:thiol-disulfide isomerase/thioredoxin
MKVQLLKCCLYATLLGLAAMHVPAAALGGGAEITPVEKPYAAPALGLKDTQGNMHHLSDYQGQVLVVNFWATWCPPCRKEMPSLNQAAKALSAHRVTFIAVNIGQTLAQITEFKARVPIDFPVLLDPDQGAVQRWPVLGLPTTVIVDPSGRVAYQVTGEREWDGTGIVAAIRSLAIPKAQ